MVADVAHALGAAGSPAPRTPGSSQSTGDLEPRVGAHGLQVEAAGQAVALEQRERVVVADPTDRQGTRLDLGGRLVAA